MHICDIIGNALADEAASLAAKRLRPNQIECKEAETIHNLAFHICIRLAFTQARVWELTDGVRMYEAPLGLEEAGTSFENIFQGATEDLSAKGHDMITAQQLF